MTRPDPSEDAKTRVNNYLTQITPRVYLKGYLGGGTDGEVWETTRETAIKALERERGYCNERDTYLRLRELGVTEKICGFWVPSLLGYSDDLMIVEMDMMQDPPYIIDFAKVRLDRPPDFSEEVIRDRDEIGRETFEHHWPEVLSLMETLESYQIYYLDPRRGNITFPDMP